MWSTGWSWNTARFCVWAWARFLGNSYFLAFLNLRILTKGTREFLWKNSVYQLPNINWQDLPLRPFPLKLHSGGQNNVYHYVCSNEGCFLFIYFLIQCRFIELWAIWRKQIFIIQLFNYLFIPSSVCPNFVTAVARYWWVIGLG